MTCNNLFSLSQDKCLGHIFLLHHLNVMLSHLTFLYFNWLVYLRDRACWLNVLFKNVSKSNFPTANIGSNPHCVSTVANWFPFLNDKGFNLLFDAKKMSCVTAVPWVLNVPSLHSCSCGEQKEPLECLTLVINPKATVRLPGHTSRVKYREAKKDPIPNPPTSKSLCLWDSISSCL